MGAGQQALHGIFKVKIGQQDLIERLAAGVPLAPGKVLPHKRCAGEFALHHIMLGHVQGHRHRVPQVDGIRVVGRQQRSVVSNGGTGMDGQLCDVVIVAVLDQQQAQAAGGKQTGGFPEPNAYSARRSGSVQKQRQQHAELHQKDRDKQPFRQAAAVQVVQGDQQAAQYGQQGFEFDKQRRIGKTDRHQEKHRQDAEYPQLKCGERSHKVMAQGVEPLGREASFSDDSQFL